MNNLTRGLVKGLKRIERGRHDASCGFLRGCMYLIRSGTVSTWRRFAFGLPCFMSSLFFEVSLFFGISKFNIIQCATFTEFTWTYWLRLLDCNILKGDRVIRDHLLPFLLCVAECSCTKTDKLQFMRPLQKKLSKPVQYCFEGFSLEAGDRTYMLHTR